jgi:hypothetical protein
MDKREARKIIELVKVAQKLGREAGEKQYQKLLGQGDRWKVINEATGKEVGRMLDVCGIGWVKIPGNGKITGAFKKLGTQDNRNNNINIDGMSIWKSDKGYVMSLSLTNRQEMSVHEEAVNKVANYLEGQGLECKAVTVID